MSDRLDLKQYIEAKLLDGDEIQKGQMIASTELLEVLQSYIDSKIIEARIDELEIAQKENDGAHNHFATGKYLQDRIKALNHRKER